MKKFLSIICITLMLLPFFNTQYSIVQAQGLTQAEQNLKNQLTYQVGNNYIVTNHVAERMHQRRIHADEVGDTLRFGKVFQDRDTGGFKYNYRGVSVITDASDTTILTTYEENRNAINTNRYTY